MRVRVDAEVHEFQGQWFVTFPGAEGDDATRCVVPVDILGNPNGETLAPLAQANVMWACLHEVETRMAIKQNEESHQGKQGRRAFIDLESARAQQGERR